MTTKATQRSAQVSILIVDDDEVTRLVLQELLKELCRELLKTGTLTIKTAEDGPTALTLAAARAPDLVLMDVQMPALDGIETFYELKALWGGTPVNTYFLSGSPRDGHSGGRIRQAIQDGALGFATKPVAMEDLARIVRCHAFVDVPQPASSRHLTLDARSAML